LAGLNVFKGAITCKGVADAFKLQYIPADKALQN
jgi:alanine dehydrogenase